MHLYVSYAATPIQSNCQCAKRVAWCAHHEQRAVSSCYTARRVLWRRRDWCEGGVGCQSGHSDRIGVGPSRGRTWGWRSCVVQEESSIPQSLDRSDMMSLTAEACSQAQMEV